jgi:formate-dependent nitrite reductase membrane component NrfD
MFLTLTGILLVKDLDRPERFLYVLLRPNWNSWLVKGAYILLGYATVLTASAVVLFMGLDRNLLIYLAYAGVPLAALTGVYTAWLFQQAKGRSWSEDQLLPLRFLYETLGAGLGALIILQGQLLGIILGIACLYLVWLGGKKTVMKPQMEPLL